MMDRRRLGRGERASGRWVPTLLVSMAALGVTAGFSRFSFAVALPEMTDDVFGSYTVAGAVVALSFSIYLLAVMLVRQRASSLDPSRLAAVGVALAAIGLITVGLAPNTGVVVVGSLLLGVAAAGGFVPVTAIIVTVAPPAKRGMAMGIGLAGIGGSVVISGQALALLEHIGAGSPWRAMFLMQGGVSAVVAVLAHRVLPALPPVPTPAATVAVEVPVLRHLPGGPALLTCYTCFGLAVSTYTGFLVSAARDDRHLSARHAVLLSSVMGVAMAAALVVGRMSDRLGRRRTMLIGTLVIALCAVVVPVGYEPWLALSALCAGLSISGVGAVTGAYLGDHLDTAGVTSVMGLLTLGMAMAQIVAPPIGGWLTDRTGSFTATFGFAAIMAVVAAIAAGRLPPDHERSASRAADAGRDLVPPVPVAP